MIYLHHTQHWVTGVDEAFCTSTKRGCAACDLLEGIDDGEHGTPAWPRGLRAPLTALWLLAGGAR